MAQPSWKKLLVSSLLVGLGSPASAGVIRVPQDAPTIQAAIAAAPPGDTIFVDRGTYPGVVIPKDEATFFRELRTPQFPATPVPVGYCRQNGRCRRCSATRHSSGTATYPTKPSASTHVSLPPPPCDELTTSEPRRMATRVSPPGLTLTSRPNSRNGPARAAYECRSRTPRAGQS